MNFEPDIGQKLRILRNNYKVFGLGATVRMAVAFLASTSLRDRFDDEYGVTTKGHMEPTQAGVPDADAPFAVRYVPTHPRVMRCILDSLEIGYQDYSFVDLGCGKGRAVLMAAERPFNRVIGVELSPALCDIAERNVERVRKANRLSCTDIEIMCANATEFVLPNTNVVFYMYHPFLAPVLRRVLHNIAMTRGGKDVLLVYACPVQEVLIDSSGLFERVAEHQVIFMEHSWIIWRCSAG